MANAVPVPAVVVTSARVAPLELIIRSTTGLNREASTAQRTPPIVATAAWNRNVPKLGILSVWQRFGQPPVGASTIHSADVRLTVPLVTRTEKCWRLDRFASDSR